MTNFDYTQYEELAEGGFEDKQPVAPEEEFFHSLYIAGQTRQNHAGITEKAGLLQIRGVDYNKESVHFIITHIKKVLAKINRDPKGKETIECFSYKTSTNPPWYGYNNRQCGENSAARAADSFCSSCREQIIVSGIYCDQNGSPIVTNEGRPIFLFIRGKGMKYNNISKYLGELAGEDMDPIIQPVTEGSKEFEKKAINNKRYVTVATVGYANSNFGTKQVFELNRGIKNTTNVVFDIIELTKKTLSKFNEKFDWSKTNKDKANYSQDSKPAPSSDQMIPDATPQNIPNDTQKQAAAPEVPKQKPFNFEDIKF